MKIKKTAIIFGISGQDGAYLSHFLLKKGYKVFGTTRNKSLKNLYRLKKLNILNKIKIIKGEATNPDFCKKILKSQINTILEDLYFIALKTKMNIYFTLKMNIIK